jgi:hypothetical protein
MCLDPGGDFLDGPVPFEYSENAFEGGQLQRAVQDNGTPIVQSLRV